MPSSTPRTILHVDMDAFYAAVEQRDAPELRGRPVIVGGPSRRGVVLAASYEVRRHGVRSAMPMAEALRRAPFAVVVPPRRGRYAEASAAAFAIFRRYTPLVEPLSLDEAFLDVTASGALFGDGAAVAARIKRDVREELGLTASAGVAPGKFAAKIASDLRKPDGLVVVPPGTVAAFLEPLEIERMWGVGPKTAPRLRALGYATLGDLARASDETLEATLGAWGRTVGPLARGVDDREVRSDGACASVSAEATYDEDLVGYDAIARTLLVHAGRVARRLVEGSMCARTVVLKIKYADFTVRSRREMLPEPVQDTDSLYETALRLLARVPLDSRRVRLTGVCAGGLAAGPPPQRLLPDEQADKRRKLEEVTLDITRRFAASPDASRFVTRASLLDRRR